MTVNTAFVIDGAHEIHILAILYIHHPRRKYAFECVITFRFGEPPTPTLIPFRAGRLMRNNPTAAQKQTHAWAPNTHSRLAVVLFGVFGLGGDYDLCHVTLDFDAHT